MHCTSFQVAAVALLAGVANAKMILVEVGKGGLVYSPDTIEAAVGDVVEFHFDAKHSVVASDFKKPCTPAASGGFFSGFLPTSDTSTFAITVNNTDPIFFYCAVSDHCEEGMVGVINQGPDTLDAYRSAAAQVDSTVVPSAPFGGNMGGSSSSVSSTTMSSTISSLSMSMSMAGTKTGSGSTTMTAVTSGASGAGNTPANGSPSASGSQSASGSPTSPPSSGNQPGAAENLNGAIAGVAGLALAIAGLLVF